MPSCEPVHTVVSDGQTYVLPKGVDVTVRFQDAHGMIHDTPEQAVRANNLNRVEDLILGVTTGYDREVVMSDVLAMREALIEALNALA